MRDAIRRWVLVGLACLGFSGAVSAEVTFDIDLDGQLIGARNILLNGELYDVAFVDGTCVELFGGCDDIADFVLVDRATAEIAAQALLDFVLIDGALLPDGSLSRFDSLPILARGCETE